MPPNSLDGASSFFSKTMIPNILPKTTKEFFNAKNWKILDLPCQSPDLNTTEYGFHIVKEIKVISPWNKQELKMAAVQAWQSITRDGTQHLVMSVGCRF